MQLGGGGGFVGLGGLVSTVFGVEGLVMKLQNTKHPQYKWFNLYQRNGLYMMLILKTISVALNSYLKYADI